MLVWIGNIGLWPKPVPIHAIVIIVFILGSLAHRSKHTIEHKGTDADTHTHT